MQVVAVVVPLQEIVLALLVQVVVLRVRLMVQTEVLHQLILVAEAVAVVAVLELSVEQVAQES
jgi:hypothetical protein